MSEWPPEAPTSPYPLFTRIIAYHLDSFWWLIPLVPVASGGLDPRWLASVALLAVSFRAISTWRFGGTPFKRLFGMTVVTEESGQRLSLGRSLLREVPLLLLFPYWLPDTLQGSAAMAFGVFYFSDQIMFLARDDRRTLHDLLAGSVVVSDYALPRQADGVPGALVTN